MDAKCPIYSAFSGACTLELIDAVDLFVGRELTWHYLRRQGTIKNVPISAQLNFLRRQVTFNKDFVMANQDPFVVSKGGKLVDQLIFLNPLRLRSDEISGTPVATQDQTGFTVDNIQVNNVPVTNEDGIEFPAGTVIQFDCLAPGSLGTDLDFDEALLYFSFVSVAGLALRISHPIRVVDSIEVK